MKLLIVESPSKAKTIGKYLGREYTVVPSIGHIRDLPKSNKKAIDIEHGFIPHYVITPGKEEVVEKIKELAKKATAVFLATDPDREGEAIAWHVAETCELKKPERVLFYEITPAAVREALAHPRGLDKNLRRAQEARRVLDRLVGYDLSGLIWKKVRYGLSAGRVQSPALHILVEREKLIRAFQPETYWVITALCATEKKESILFTCSQELRDQKQVEDILQKGKAENWKVIDVTSTEAVRRPRPPFTTSTLQQTASSRLGFSPSRTMRLAQKLYEAGHITYMRTDSMNLGQEALGRMLSFIQKNYGREYATPRQYKTKSKNAQEAHEAIRPTEFDTKNHGQSEEEKRLYALIMARTLASQMADAKILRTRIVANTEKRSLPDFTASGNHLLFDGWLKADPKAREEDVELPQVKAHEKLTLKDIASQQKETEPPYRYTEAGLVKELEKRGLGRPSTYASILSTIITRGYVVKDGKTLSPTETGEVVDDFLASHFARFVSDSFTADMENKLDEIADGERDYTKTLTEFYGPFSKEVKSKDKLEKMTNLGPAPDGMLCPKCGSAMIIKLGRAGKFYSCSRFPDCDGALTLEGKEMAGPKLTGEKCPDCGKGDLVEREGRFGKFIACSTYPKCKYIKNDENAERPTTGIKCPVCQKGEMMERRGRYGVFYSCSNYPKCKNAIKAKPTGQICKLCGALMMEGTKTIPERCSNKNCLNHRPDKLKENAS